MGFLTKVSDGFVSGFTNEAGTAPLLHSPQFLNQLLALMTQVLS